MDSFELLITSYFRYLFLPYMIGVHISKGDYFIRIEILKVGSVKYFSQNGLQALA